MIDKEKGIWSEFAEEEILDNQPKDEEWQENGLPADFTDKYHNENDNQQVDDMVIHVIMNYKGELK